MGSKKSSFHISDEFNGKGNKVYLRASQFKTYDPSSTKSVKPIRKFTGLVQKAEGAMPIMIVASTKAGPLLSAIGAVASVGRVIVTKDETKGKYKMDFDISKIQLTTGSYLHKSKTKQGQMK